MKTDICYGQTLLGPYTPLTSIYSVHFKGIESGAALLVRHTWYNCTVAHTHTIVNDFYDNYKNCCDFISEYFIKRIYCDVQVSHHISSR